MAEIKPHRSSKKRETAPDTRTESPSAGHGRQKLEDLDFLHAPSFLGKLEEDQMPWRAEDCVEPG